MADQLAVPTILARRLTDGRETVWLRIGDLRFLMMDLDGALVAYKFALECNPTNVSPLTQAGASLAKRERYSDAVVFLEQAVQASPACGEAWAILAHCYVMTDDLNKAYNAYQSALNHLANPRDPNLWYGIGLLYDRYGSLENALEAFLAVLNIAPDFERAEEVCFCIGIIYKEQSKYDEALEYFNKAVAAVSPQPPLTRADAWYQIGHVHELKNDLGAAVETYHRALTENPNHAKSLQQLGWLTHQQGNSAEAVRLLDRSTQAEPAEGQSWYLLGRVYMANREFRRAYDAYQQAVYRDGMNATFWCSIGVLYYNMQQHRDAMDAYSRAIRLNPKISEVWFDLGTLYESCNQISDATDAYRRAAELAPDNHEITQRLAILQRSLQTGVPPPPASAPTVADGPPVAVPSSSTQAHVTPGPLFASSGAFPTPPMPTNPDALRRTAAPGIRAPGGVPPLMTSGALAMSNTAHPTPSLRPVPSGMPSQSTSSIGAHQLGRDPHLQNSQPRHPQAPQPLQQQPLQQLQPLLPQQSQPQHQRLQMEQLPSRSQPELSVDKRPVQNSDVPAGPGHAIRPVGHQPGNQAYASNGVNSEMQNRQHLRYSDNAPNQGVVSQPMQGSIGYQHSGAIHPPQPAQQRNTDGQPIVGHGPNAQQRGQQSPPRYSLSQQQGRANQEPPAVSLPQPMQRPIHSSGPSQHPQSNHGTSMSQQNVGIVRESVRQGPHGSGASGAIENVALSRSSDVTSQSIKPNAPHGRSFQSQEVISAGGQDLKGSADRMQPNVAQPQAGHRHPSSGLPPSNVHAQQQYTQPPTSQNMPRPHMQGNQIQSGQGQASSVGAGSHNGNAHQYIAGHDSRKSHGYNYSHSQNANDGMSSGLQLPQDNPRPAPISVSAAQQMPLPSPELAASTGSPNSHRQATQNVHMQQSTVAHARHSLTTSPNPSIPLQQLPGRPSPPNQAPDRDGQFYRSQGYRAPLSHPTAGDREPRSQGLGAMRGGVEAGDSHHIERQGVRQSGVRHSGDGVREQYVGGPSGGTQPSQNALPPLPQHMSSQPRDSQGSGQQLPSLRGSVPTSQGMSGRPEPTRDNRFLPPISNIPKVDTSVHGQAPNVTAAGHTDQIRISSLNDSARPSDVPEKRESPIHPNKESHMHVERRNSGSISSLVKPNDSSIETERRRIPEGSHAANVPVPGQLPDQSRRGVGEIVHARRPEIPGQAHTVAPIRAVGMGTSSVLEDKVETGGTGVAVHASSREQSNTNALPSLPVIGNSSEAMSRTLSNSKMPHLNAPSGGLINREVDGEGKTVRHPGGQGNSALSRVVRGSATDVEQKVGENGAPVDEAMLPTLTPLREKSIVPLAPMTLNSEKEAAEQKKKDGIVGREHLRVPRSQPGPHGESAQTESESGSGAITPAVPSPNSGEAMEVPRGSDLAPRGKDGNASGTGIRPVSVVVPGKGMMQQEDMSISPANEKAQSNSAPKPGPLPSFLSSMHGRRSSTPDGIERSEEKKGRFEAELKSKNSAMDNEQSSEVRPVGAIAASLMTLSRPVYSGPKERESGRVEAKGKLNSQKGVDIPKFPNPSRTASGNDASISRRNELSPIRSSPLVESGNGSIGKGANSNGEPTKVRSPRDVDRESNFRKGKIETRSKSPGDGSGTRMQEVDSNAEIEMSTVRSPRGQKRPRSEGSYGIDGVSSGAQSTKKHLGMGPSGSSSGVTSIGVTSVPPLRSVPVFPSGTKPGSLAPVSSRNGTNGVARDSAPTSPSVSRSSSERRRSDNREYRGGRERNRYHSSRHSEDRHRDRRRDWPNRRPDRDRESGRDWERSGDRDRERDWDRDREYRERDNTRGPYFPGRRR